MDTAVLFDGNNVLIRAHSGMSYSGLSTSEGVPSGGLYGVIRVLHMYIQKMNPTHIVWTWDGGKSDFRTALRSEYKGNRPKKTEPGEDEKYDSLVSTFSAFGEYLSLLGVRQIRVKGTEADDLMAQFTKEHRDEIPITLVTADHDLRQLVRQPNPYPVMVLKPSMSSRGGHSVKEVYYTYDKVIEEYKLPPHRLPELWAIQGDSSDNIKGVPGMGPVKSLQALKEFGDLQSVIAKHPKLQGLERQIHDNYRMIVLPHEQQGPLPFTLEGCRWQPDNVDYDGVEKFFTKWEFSSFLLKLTTSAGLFGNEEDGMKVGLGNA